MLSALCPTKCPQNQFFANISKSMRLREKIVGTENVRREISHKIGHSRVSLCVPISLKIYSNGYKSRFLLFFTFLATLLRIFRDLWGLGGKFVRFENVPREISYKVSHSRVTFVKMLPKTSRESKISIFTYFNRCISRLKGRFRLTLEWRTLYEISRGTFLAPTIFHLGPSIAKYLQ